MTCTGCSGAIERVLKKTEGLSPPSPISHPHLPSPSLPPSPIPIPIPLTPTPSQGLSSYTVSLEQQSADVYTETVPFETVLEKIRKTGKEVRGAEVDGGVVGI